MRNVKAMINGIERDIYMVTIRVSYCEHTNGKTDISYAVLGHVYDGDYDEIASFRTVEAAIRLHKQLNDELKQEELQREEEASAVPFPEVANG